MGPKMAIFLFEKFEVIGNIAESLIQKLGLDKTSFSIQ
jgi:hypothetical protein